MLFILAGESRAEIKNPLVREINHKISRYLLTKLGTSLSTGFVVWVVLFAFRVELAFMFAILAVFLNFIPSVGSIFATIIPLPVVWLQYGFDWRFMAVLLLTTLTQIIIGNIIEPKLMGQTMGLHPVTVLLALAFWGLLWGIVGMLLAVPIVAMLRIVLSHFGTTRALAGLLAGRLPGTDEPSTTADNMIVGS